MRKVVFGGAISLDNFLARPDGAVDWIMWSDEAAQIMKDLWPRFDTIVMGRKTYDHSLKYAPAETDAATNIPTYVFSRTLPAGKNGLLQITDADPGEFVRELKLHDGKDICIMGGGDIGRTLFEAGVIDEIGFNIHPVLLGKGIPLYYETTKQIDLELIETRQMKNGCIYVLYRVKH
jgi:dihydrofolate reductase